MTIVRTAGAIIAAIGLFTAVGCSTAVEETPVSTTVETVTQSQLSPTAEVAPITVTDEPMPAPTTGGATTPGSPGDGELPEDGTGPADPADPTAADIPDTSELPPDPVGKDVTIAGAPATVCIYGDGWGTNVWAGNANASCEFVSAVHEELVEGLDPTRDNIRQNLKPAITVTSPVTQQSYDMTCVQRSEELLSCTGGANATVFFY